MQLFDLNKIPLDGAHLIEASAGTGKTFAITNIYLRLLLEKNLSVDRILVVTFTKAATAELKDRIRARIGEAIEAIAHPDKNVSTPIDKIIQPFKENRNAAEGALLRLRLALLDFDMSAIFTIHGFCERMSSEFAFDANLPMNVELTANGEELIKQAAMDAWRELFYKGNNSELAYLNEFKFNEFLDLALAVAAYSDAEVRLCDRDFTGVISDAKVILDGLKKWCEQCEDAVYTRHVLKKGLCDEIVTIRDYRELIFEVISNRKNLELEKVRKNIKSNYICELEVFERLQVFIDNVISSKSMFKKIFVEKFEEKFKKNKEFSRVRTFNDILIHTRDAVKGNKRFRELIRQRFDAVLIDEFQDTDPIQYEIFRNVFVEAGTTVYFIGDPKQSIYRFRGADINTYLKAKHDVGANVWTMDKNYRSTKAMIEAVNALFSHVENPFGYEQIQYTKVNAGHDVGSFIDNGEEVAEGIRVIKDPGEEVIGKVAGVEWTNRVIAQEIVRLLEQARIKKDNEVYKIRPSDIAVLVDSHDNAKKINRVLEKYGVPSVLQGTGNVFASMEAEELLAIFQAIASPQDRTIRSAVATSMFGYGVEELMELSDEDMIKLYERFRTFGLLWSQHGMMVAMSRLMEEFNVKERILKQVNGERAITNYMHLMELCHQMEMDSRANIYGVIKWLQSRIQDSIDSNVPQEHEIRLSKDDEAVQIVTVHSSKGLEYPVVFVGFEWARSINNSKKKVEPAFDQEAGRRYICMNEDNEDYKKNWVQEAEKEHVRLLYVAMTRAKYITYLVMPRYKSISNSAIGTVMAGEDSKQVDITGVFNEMEGVARTSSGRIKVLEMNDKGSVFYKGAKKERLDLKVRNFQRLLKHFAMLHSFSSIKAHSEKRTEYIIVDDMEIESGMDSEPVLPKGIITGLAVHRALELIDFQRDVESEKTQEVIRRVLGHYWTDVDMKLMVREVSDMIKRVLEAPLKGFSLKDVALQDTLREVKFIFPLKKAGALREFYEKKCQREEFIKALQGLKNEGLHGYMVGYIDLFFRHNDKYYIVDWKTNYLGDKSEDYNQDALKDSILQSMYFLQYHIYTVAVDLFLEKGIEGYDYERDFGGVFYVYTRGVDGLGNGISFDRPEGKFIRAFRQWLKNEQV